MFKFLKDKLKGAIASLSKKVEEEEAPAEPAPAPEKPQEKKGIFQRLKEKVVRPAEEEEPSAPIERLATEAKKAVKPKEAKLDADKIEAVIRDVDIHAPLPLETEPEPVPAIELVKEIESKPEIRKSESQPKKTPKTESTPVERYQHVTIKAEPVVLPQQRKVEPEQPKARPEVKPEIKPVGTSETSAQPAEKKGFFGRIADAITTKKISGDEFENLFWELEVVLLENNVAVEVIEKIKQDLSKSVVDTPIPRGKVEKAITDALHQSLKDLLSVPTIDIVRLAQEKKPLVIAFVGVNGSGKTTTIAKVAQKLLDQKLSVVLAAGDTFRAAAIDQLDMHAKKLGVKIIKHDYGADPAAVAFDAVKHAKAKNVDVVLIDTAGRLHSNINLVDEMKKIMRVAKPDLKIFVGESITGNDCVEQAQQFNSAIGIDGIILTKADVDEKGGAAISVSYVTKKPILYLGMGQEYADLQPFDGEQILASIGLGA